ncbi:MAG: arabinogalactan endo-1,4-beta-galactosidase [Thermofilaceae archaeon]|nr:arabinogalactan endo-1,4-beta-galactosidase [Thermofilaceae archaeon]MCX8180050.1 arabinogalactan endo-1,4-beta-galactosidase [Thermofilaceae archaeon]MDW8003207.1 glycosyl hydrolase 53 family protein [Thermofilaceae archaeon]
MDFLCGRVPSRLIVVVSCVIILSALVSLWIYVQLCVKVEPIESRKSVETGRAGETTLGKDALAIMKSYEANCFRLRLFVNPKQRDEWGGFTGNNLEYTIKLAKRIKGIGAKLILDLHYSDTWADLQRQDIPVAWRGLSYEQLVEKVYEYTRSVMVRMREEGVLPDMVQIGNEITCGILWPVGKVCDVENSEEQWKRFTTLLKAAVKGVREGVGNTTVKIILHIHGEGFEVTRWFFSYIERHGVEYDVIGLSYYPWWHGSLSNLRVNIQNTVMVFGKEVLIVETAYPYYYVDLSQIAWAETEYVVWDFTPEGQRSFLMDLAKVANVPGCIGLLWWYPEAMPVGDLNVWLGGAAALFDLKGKPLPALKAFREIRELVGSSFLLGGDVSSLAEIERLGGVYSD